MGRCKTFPCIDVNNDAYIIPDVDVKPEDITVVLISEAAPANLNDYYYSEGNPSFQSL
jgi:hypothetical protein